MVPMGGLDRAAHVGPMDGLDRAAHVGPCGLRRSCTHSVSREVSIHTVPPYKLKLSTGFWRKLV